MCPLLHPRLAGANRAEVCKRGASTGTRSGVAQARVARSVLGRTDAVS